MAAVRDIFNFNRARSLRRMCSVSALTITRPMGAAVNENGSASAAAAPTSVNVQARGRRTQIIARQIRINAIMLSSVYYQSVSAQQDGLDKTQRNSIGHPPRNPADQWNLREPEDDRQRLQLPAPPAKTCDRGLQEHDETKRDRRHEFKKFRR